MKGKPWSKKTKKKISDSMKGHVVSAETRRLMSDAQYQRLKPTQATKELISLAMMGNNNRKKNQKKES